MDDVKRYIDACSFNDPLAVDRCFTRAFLFERLFEGVEKDEHRLGKNLKTLILLFKPRFNDCVDIAEIRLVYELYRRGELVWDENNRITELVWKGKT